MQLSLQFKEVVLDYLLSQLFTLKCSTNTYFEGIKEIINSFIIYCDDIQQHENSLYKFKKYVYKNHNKIQYLNLYFKKCI